MIDNEGRLYVTPDELAVFVVPALEHMAAIVPGPVAPYLWVIDPKTGICTVRRGVDAIEVPPHLLLLMTGPDPAWAQQWAGDLERACDEQLNPMLRAYLES